jgi:halogenation protein CepH
MTVDEHTDVDVVVVGGGPAGSTLASLVAMRGHRVVVVEKERFPRYQIGESLLPATVRGVCTLTGVAPTLDQAGFTIKRGGTFRWGTSPDPWTFSFAASPQLAGRPSHAYQVERSRFDTILLDHAAKLGADVRQETEVTDILTDDQRVHGVTVRTADGHESTITARYVVDASGNLSTIHTHAGGTRQYSDFFRSLALFGYFEGGRRLPSPNSGNILCVAFPKGWFWYIPLTDRLTSVGAVVRREFAHKIQGDRETALADLIAECPLIAEHLHGATRITQGQYGQLRVRKDYSYTTTALWRPGMALIGDAACFVDPVFSSGVHLATYGALLAGRSINSVLDGSLDEPTAFAEFDARYRREYHVFHGFLKSFYAAHTDETSYYQSARHVTHDPQPATAAFATLVGGLSSGETTLTGPAQPATPAGYIIDDLAGREHPMKDWFAQSSVADTAREMVQLQSSIQGTTEQPEAPLFDSGLVPSTDGLAWQHVLNP